MTADAAPDRAAVSDGDRRLDLGRLAASARGAAATLQAAEGERVVFLGLNGEAVSIAIFASALVGKPFVPLNYRLADDALRRLVERSAPAVAVVDDNMLPRVSAIAGITYITRSVFEAAYRDPTNQRQELPVVDADIAVLLFTSGTTGDPKAAVLRHHHLTSYVVSTVDFLGAEEDEASLVSVPPYHIAGISAVLTGIYSGRQIVYLPSFTPEAWVDAAVANKVTHAMVVPTMLGRILDVLDARGIGLPHLKALSYGGGRMPLPVIERAMARLPHVDFVNAYGLTETSSTVAVLGPDDHRQAMASSDPAVRRRMGSVGRPLPTLELEIRDPEGRVVPTGESGEIHVRGEQVAGEYLERKVIAEDGWFATNDAGWLDKEGFLFVEGRLDDVIVRGGENISPGEIEDVLRAHPAIADLAVFGVPDDQWGERIACVVVARGTPPATADLADWVKARLRSTKTPDVWEFRAELPYNDMGKLLRRVLRDDILARDRETASA